MRKAVFSVLLTGSAILLGALPHISSAAFGISPPFMHADHLVPGSRFVQTVYLVQDQPTADLRIKANLDIPDRVRSWVSIDQGFDFTIPKGTRQFPVAVTVSVPKNAELTAYRGNLTFTGAPAQNGQVTIALGAQVSIDIRVGNDIYENFTIPIVRFLDIEEGWNPRVYVKFNNEGNVPESFTHANYELLDQYGTVRLAYIQKADGFPEVPAFSVKEFSVDFPVDFHLGIGQYWGKVDFYQNDKIVASQKTVFNVLKAGSLSGPWSAVLDVIQKYWTYATLILVLAALGLLGWFKFRRRS